MKRLIGDQIEISEGKFEILDVDVDDDGHEIYLISKSAELVWIKEADVK